VASMGTSLVRRNGSNGGGSVRKPLANGCLCTCAHAAHAPRIGEEAVRRVVGTRSDARDNGGHSRAALAREFDLCPSQQRLLVEDLGRDALGHLVSGDWVVTTTYGVEKRPQIIVSCYKRITDPSMPGSSRTGGVPVFSPATSEEAAAGGAVGSGSASTSSGG
jgi:hypothetical protein